MFNSTKYTNQLLKNMGLKESEPPSLWAIGSLLFGFAGAFLFVISGYGYQWNWWQLGTAFTWIMSLGTMLGLIGVSMGFFFGFSKWGNPQKRGLSVALVGLLMGLSVMGTAIYWFIEVQQYPPIHDISTDTDHPPTFKAIVPLRADAKNDTTYGDQEKADMQRRAYPKVQTLYLDVGYNKAFDRAMNAAEQMPWENIAASIKKAGRIEAVDELAWFGFKDDIVIRVDSAEKGDRSKIDVRSASRIGRGDIGVNAQRIREYLQAVKSQ